ncbi:MAG TPA: preprotein translocase subunit YajC [Gammaproteobacteria bacterium]|nr:preprotein translocase subunit YajC [Gammaproteobacteria bacterium]
MHSLLSFFISDAAAQGAGAGTAGPNFLWIMLPMIVVMYIFLFVPQQKKQKEHRKMIESLAAGNEVVTGGGVLGKITEVGEQFVTIEVSNGVHVKVQRGSIAAVVPKDTIKNA